MESLIRDQLVLHLANNQLLRTSQIELMSGSSTLNNLLEYREVLTKLVDDGHSVDILYLDFAKALEKVPRQRLIDKCRGLGVGENVLAWIKEWLCDRKQRVFLNGQYSDWGNVLSGVPQGSLLGPTLFLMYINDIDLAVDVSGSYLLKFADDTKWSKVVETEDQNQVFQEGILRLED
jgi:ribonuclease P/MRP protein subunit RPP40